MSAGEGDLEMDHAAERRVRRLAILFDLRMFIGSLFLIFGVIVTVDGVGATEADIARSVGLHLGLWTGAAMVVIALVFIVWTLLSPPDIRPRSGVPVEPPAGH